MSKRRKKRASRKPLESSAAPRVSLCMIVRNEERSLGRCLESVQGFVDEIVVVDTGSTDRTPDVARQFGAKLFFEEWRGDFSAARNRSLKEATGDWVFLLDADEVIPKRDLPRLKKAVTEPRADAYRMTTRNYRRDPGAYGVQRTCGEFEEEVRYPFWVPTTKIRLFRRVPGVEFRGAVHELVEESIAELGLKVADLDVPVLHFGDVEKERAPDRYLEVAERKVRDRPEDPLAFQELAIIQERVGRREEAIQSCEKAFELLAQGKGNRYCTPEILYNVKGRALQGLGKYTEAIACYEEGLQQNPRSHELANNLGVCYECLGDYQKAAEWYRRALDVRPDLPLAQENLERVKRKIRKERTLSVCMIVRNGAETLARALESATHFADEIIVVDTGSTDDTVAIAERYGAKVSHFQWQDDFAAARNASLDLATGDWIMWLDADDYVPATEWPKLQEIKFQPLNQAFMFLLQNEGLARESCWQVRMFPNRPELRFRYPVHEQIAPALVEHGYPIRTTNITVVHTGYPNEDVVRQKKEKYLRLLLAYLERHPDDPVSRYHVAFTHHTTGRHRQAVAEFEKVVRSDECREKHPRTYASAWLYLGRSYLALGEEERAIRALEKAMEFEPGSPLAMVSLAQCYNRLDQPEEALRWLDRFRSSPLSPSTMPLDLEALSYAAEYQRGLALEKLGRVEEAVHAYLASQRYTNRSRQSVRRAIFLLPRLMESSQSEAAIQELVSSVGDSAAELFELGNALVRAENLDAAEKSYRRAIETEAGHVGAVRALAAVLRRTGRADEAVAVLQQGIRATGSEPALVADLADLLFQLRRWEEIRAMGSTEIWPTRAAAAILTGNADALLEELSGRPEFLSSGVELDAERLWEVARLLDEPYRFHLAVACAALEPGLREAVECAVDGLLRRGLASEALPLAEAHVRVSPADKRAFELLARCYRGLGVHEAAEMCEQRARTLAPVNAELPVSI